MERIDPNAEGFVVLGEHVHRYKWAAQFAKGTVLDAACGAGYGSQVLATRGRVNRYIGIDIDDDSIAQAVKKYASGEIKFIHGDCLSMPFDDTSVDTVVSLETLEHLDDPSLAVSESVRVLRNKGVYIGSVPDEEYEIKCNEAYGKNPFHKATFNERSLRRLLEQHFRYVHLFRSSLQITSIVTPNDRNSEPRKMIMRSLDKSLGSILFVASNNRIKMPRQISETEVLGPLVAYDKLYITTRNDSINRQAEMIDERDQLIRAVDMHVKELRKTIDDQAQTIDDKDSIIQGNDMLIQSLYSTIRDQAKLVDDRDAVIARQARRIEELGEQLKLKSLDTGGDISDDKL